MTATKSHPMHRSGSQDPSRTSDASRATRPGPVGGPSSFANDRRGATAIEFAMLAFPFLLIVFAIFETTMVFIGDTSLNFEVQRMARSVRTGKVTQAAMNEAAFRRQLCRPVSYLVNCEKLKIDLRGYGTYADLPRSLPIANGVFQSASFTFETPASSEIMALRVYYEWPLFTGLMTGYLANLADGNRLVGSTSVFRTEPF